MNRLWHTLAIELRRIARNAFDRMLPFLPGPWTLIIAISFWLFCLAIKLLIGLLV
ncbi:hypothetical protein [Spirosoma harenae]